MPKPSYKQKFRSEWLMDKLFKDWILKKIQDLTDFRRNLKIIVGNTDDATTATGQSTDRPTNVVSFLNNTSASKIFSCKRKMDMAVYDPTVLDHFILGLGVRYNIRVERWGKEQKVYIVGVVGGVIGGVVGSFVSGVDGVVSGVGSVVSGATCGLVDWPTRKTISKPCSTFIGTTLGGLTNNGFVSVSFCQVWDEEQARIREGLRLMVYHFLIRLDRTDIRHAMEELENDNQRELLHLLVRAIAQYTFKALGGQRQVIVTNLI